MEGKRLIRTIKLNNLLSYGPNTPELELGPLNVLIGSNAAGKSNLIEAISLLQASPRDLAVPIRAGGGIEEWLWKGKKKISTAEIEVTVFYPQGYIFCGVRYYICKCKLLKYNDMQR